jgi:DNA-binding transcriptional ArsR family regulator
MKNLSCSVKSKAAGGGSTCSTVTRSGQRPDNSETSTTEPEVSEALAERLADTMFALSAPSRVLILGSLLHGSRSVRDLTEALGMEQSAVSHQLRILREHNLVQAEKVGRLRVYALYDDHVATLLHAGLNHVGRAHPASSGKTQPRSGRDPTTGAAS